MPGRVGVAGWPQGIAIDVEIVDNYADIALGTGGLGVIAVSNPANPVRVDGYTNGDFTQPGLTVMPVS